MRVCLVLAPFLALSSWAGCDESSGPSFEATTSTTTAKSGSGGGFSADLAKSLGSGSGGGSGSATAGSATASAGSAGSGSATVATNAGSGSAAAGSATASAGSGNGSATVATNAGSGSAAAGSATASAGSGSGSAAVATNAGSATTPAIKPRVTPPAELAAIKLSLSPNWDRDAGEAGTISLAVKIPGTDQTRTFTFRYGVEDPKAPADRDAYKKWLADNKILDAKVDRQRGAAWYLEGTDGAGAPTFRIIVQYGGKKLVCGGSLYRDAASSQLGDIRDKTIIQAKEICETLAL